MARKHHKPEEIIAKRRGAEVLLARGRSVADAARASGTTEQSSYRCRREYGGLKMDQARRLKDLERENPRLRKAVADLTLDKRTAPRRNSTPRPAHGSASHLTYCARFQMQAQGAMF